MKDINGQTIKKGDSVEVFLGVYPCIKSSFGVFEAQNDLSGGVFLENATCILSEDMLLADAKLRIVVKCSECGKYFGVDEVAICKECGEPVCENCQQPCSGPPNPMIDYPIHTSCYYDRIPF